MKTHKLYASWQAIVILVGIVAIFYFYLFPLFDIKSLSGGLQCLDARSGYTALEVKQLFTALGNDGMQQYKYFILIDTIFPLVYGFLLVFCLIFLLQKMGRLGKITKFTQWFPLLVVLSDYAENICIALMLNTHPIYSEKLVYLASIFTQVKWYAASICGGLIICFAMAVLLRNTLWKYRYLLIKNK